MLLKIQWGSVYNRLAEISLIVHSPSMIVAVEATPSGSNKIHFQAALSFRMSPIKEKKQLLTGRNSR